MINIGLLSDTHGYIEEEVFELFADRDEIWHAGDIGDISVLESLENFKPVRAVWGNIDDGKMRRAVPEVQLFELEGVKVAMIHIGGYPGRYNKNARALIAEQKPDLFICGHSHILKVIYDTKYECLSVNPGAIGHHGFHKVRTALRFTLHNGKVKDMDVIEFGKRGRG